MAKAKISSEGTMLKPTTPAIETTRRFLVESAVGECIEQSFCFKCGNEMPNVTRTMTYCLYTVKGANAVWHERVEAIMPNGRWGSGLRKFGIGRRQSTSA